MAEDPYILQWATLFPYKLPIRTWGSGPPSNTCFLGPSWVHIPNNMSIGSAVFAESVRSWKTPLLCYLWCTPHANLLYVVKMHGSDGFRFNTTTAATIFGRPFVKRFAICYRTVVCLSVCLSVLSCLRHWYIVSKRLDGSRWNLACR